MTAARSLLPRVVAPAPLFRGRMIHRRVGQSVVLIDDQTGRVVTIEVAHLRDGRVGLRVDAPRCVQIIPAERIGGGK